MSIYIYTCIFIYIFFCLYKGRAYQIPNILSKIYADEIGLKESYETLIYVKCFILL